ncbi:MAG: M81 family metallopeptidase [Arachnia sp.]
MRTTAADKWSPPLPPLEAGGLGRPRIGMGGVSIESSTFSAHISGWEAFRMRTGDDLLEYYPFLAAGQERREAAEWVPLLHGRSLPGGAVDPGVYRNMRDQLVSMIRNEGPFDGFFLDIHGAMSVVGMTDAEADLGGAIREALGPDTLVSASMDLHGNVSADLLRHLDLVTCYRMAPHEDTCNTKERAVHNLLVRLRSAAGSDVEARRPLKAWVQVPVLLPGEKTSTRLEPARSIYAAVEDVEARAGVLDAALWVGYAWADEPRCQAAVVVTGDDAEVVRDSAAELAQSYWNARADFAFVGPTDSFGGALDQALRPNAARPFLISDSGDNPTAGGSGDATATLRALLADQRLKDPGRLVIHASIFDPEAVAAAARAGVGADVVLAVGGRVDRMFPPAAVRAVVSAVVAGDPVAGTQVVLRSGSVAAIVTERRKPFHRLQDFRDLGLDPEEADVVIVKIGYLEPELFELAGDWVLALTPGGVDQDLLRLRHRNLAPGVWPFDNDGTSPDLTPSITRGNHAEL